MHYPLYIIFTRMSSFSAVCVGIFETMVSYSENKIIQPNNFSTGNTFIVTQLSEPIYNLKKNTNKKKRPDNSDTTTPESNCSTDVDVRHTDLGGCGTAPSCHSRLRKTTGVIARRKKKGGTGRNEEAEARNRHRSADAASTPRTRPGWPADP